MCDEDTDTGTDSMPVSPAAVAKLINAHRDEYRTYFLEDMINELKLKNAELQRTMDKQKARNPQNADVPSLTRTIDTLRDQADRLSMELRQERERKK